MGILLLHIKVVALVALYTGCPVIYYHSLHTEIVLRAYNVVRMGCSVDMQHRGCLQSSGRFILKLTVVIAALSGQKPLILSLMATFVNYFNTCLENYNNVVKSAAFICKSNIRFSHFLCLEVYLDIKITTHHKRVIPILKV